MQRRERARTYFKIWRQGHSFETVLITDADDEIREEFQVGRAAELACFKEGKPEDGRMWAALDRAKAELIPYIEEMRGMQRYCHYAPEELYTKAYTDLVELLRLGGFKAYGFEAPRRHNSAPVPIPPDLWERHIEWTQDAISGNGLEFVAVRIVSPSLERHYLEDAERQTEQLPRNPGRPTVKANIIEAFEALSASERIDFDVAMARTYGSIRLWLATTYPDRAGQFKELSDETIRSATSSLFKAAKAARKQ